MIDDSIVDLDIFLENESFFKILREYPTENVYNFLKESLEWEKSHTLAGRKIKYEQIFTDCFNSLNIDIPSRDSIKFQWSDYMIERMLDLLLLTLYGSKKDMFKDIVKIKNKQVIDQFFIDGKAPLLVSMHLDAFQMVPFVLSSYGYKTSSFMDKNAVGLWENILEAYAPDINKYAKMIGLPGKSSIKHALRDIKNGNIFTMYPEFTLGELPDFRLDFLGNKIYAPTGPAKIAKLMNIPIIPILLRKRNPLDFELVIEDPIYYPGYDIDNECITKKIFSWMEKQISANPEKWWGWSIYKENMVVPQHKLIASS